MSGTRDDLVQHLLDGGVLKTPAMVAAFRAIDRRDFVIPALTEAAYADTALPIGLGQTISQPYTVAYMLELLQPQAGHTVLDIGFGSGWQTALLAHIVGSAGHVTAIEIVPELCEMGRRNVSRYGFINSGVVEMHCRSGLPGYAERAPYDRIIVAAAGERIPPAWLEQAAAGGRIVAPVGTDIVLLKRKGTVDWEREDHPGFVFVPLVDHAA